MSATMLPDHVLIFLNEVAGGRRLVEAVRKRADSGTRSFSVVAPQNQPRVGQLIHAEELRDAALSRVEVTLAILREFGIEAEGAVLDPHPLLALDDAVRAYRPTEILVSCHPETRYGPLRRDLVKEAQGFGVPVEEVFVRISDDSVAWDVTHTLVVANQTVASGELIEHLKQKAGERRHRYTIVCPRSGQADEDRRATGDRLARTLAEMYREGIDATGQPMTPDPYAAVVNALEHYHVDEILISTFAGESSRWLQEDLVGRVRQLTNKPVDHLEAGAAPISVTPGGEEV